MMNFTIALSILEAKYCKIKIMYNVTIKNIRTTIFQKQNPTQTGFLWKPNFHYQHFVIPGFIQNDREIYNLNKYQLNKFPSSNYIHTFCLRVSIMQTNSNHIQ